MRLLIIKIFLGIIIISSLTFILFKTIPEKKIVNIIDLPEIYQKDTLRVLINPGYPEYFIYNGLPAGIYLELLENLSKSLDINIKLQVEPNIDVSINSLLNNDCDIVALLKSPNTNSNSIISYSEPLFFSHQVLIQSKQKENKTIKTISNLGRKKIHLEKNSQYKQRIKNISNEIAREVFIIEEDSLNEIEIIKKISEGKIQYSISLDHKAKFYQLLFDNIDIKTPVGFDQAIVWALRKDSPILRDSINNWLIAYKETREYQSLLKKYISTSNHKKFIKSNFSNIYTNTISPYDEIIKKYSDKYGFDWRLIASLMYQESQFNHDAVSYAGALGIMQLMPETAIDLGIDTLSGVETHIKAGIKYLSFLDSQIDKRITNQRTRNLLILASYNIGFGHIQDAIRLCEFYQKDISSWTNVSFYLAALSESEYYNLDVVKNGFIKGSRGVYFANTIYSRYNHYKNLIDKD